MKQMELNLQGRNITLDSAYLLYASAVVNIPSYIVARDNQKQIWCYEAEFFVVGTATVKEARNRARKIQNYPGIESVWIIRKRDMEVVQPHEKF